MFNGVGGIVFASTIDHVHVVWVPPKASISDFVGTVKDVRHRAQGKRHKGKKKVTSIIFYP
jgi:REP element-mobilizing transposase RayT